MKILNFSLIFTLMLILLAVSSTEAKSFAKNPKTKPDRGRGCCAGKGVTDPNKVCTCDVSISFPV